LSEHCAAFPLFLKLSRQPQAEDPALGAVSRFHGVFHILHIPGNGKDIAQRETDIGLEHLGVVNILVPAVHMGVADSHIVGRASPQAAADIEPSRIDRLVINGSRVILPSESDPYAQNVSQFLIQ